MTANESESSRRHERYDVSFALEVRENGRRIGSVKDISEGGLRVLLDGDFGDNLDVRDWTGHRGTSNREFVLSDMIGENLSLELIYMNVTMGRLKARLVRVIRVLDSVEFAMEFVEISPDLLKRVTGVAKVRAQ